MPDGKTVCPGKIWKTALANCAITDGSGAEVLAAPGSHGLSRTRPADGDGIPAMSVPAKGDIAEDGEGGFSAVKGGVAPMSRPFDDRSAAGTVIAGIISAGSGPPLPGPAASAGALNGDPSDGVIPSSVGVIAGSATEGPPAGIGWLDGESAGGVGRAPIVGLAAASRFVGRTGSTGGTGAAGNAAPMPEGAIV